jgi:hypothetical protein
VPIIGKIQYALQVLFVDRLDVNSRKTAIETIKERSTQRSRFPQVSDHHVALQLILLITQLLLLLVVLTALLLALMQPSIIITADV